MVLLGQFTLHGKINLVYANAAMKYLLGNETTKTIMLGDLISIVAKFYIKLSDFGITKSLIGNRVSDKIQMSVNLVGSNYGK